MQPKTGKSQVPLSVLASVLKFKAVESIHPNIIGKQLSFSVLANES